MGVENITNDLHKLKNNAQELRNDIANNYTKNTNHTLTISYENRFKDLCQVYKSLYNSVFKRWHYWLIWHILLDIGRFLKVFFPKKPDDWLIKVMLMLNKKKLDVHNKLVAIQALLEQSSEKTHKLNTTLNSSPAKTSPAKKNTKTTEIIEGFYYIYQSTTLLLWMREIPGYHNLPIKNLVTAIIIASSLPLFLKGFGVYLVRVKGIVSSVDTKAAFGFSNFTAILLSLLIQSFMWTNTCYRSMKKYFFNEPKWHTVKRCISPRRINWERFLRGFLYTSLFMLQSYTQVLLTTPITVIWHQWLLATCITIALLFIQTLTEEIMFRRPLLNKTDPIFPTVKYAMIFALMHIFNPEFLCISSPLGQLAFMSSYFTIGFYWGATAYFSRGIELSWGAHFANNLFLSIIVGYTPSPIQTLPLITLKFVSQLSMFSQITTTRQVGIIWLQNMIKTGKIYFRIYLLELLFRPKYYVSPINSSDASTPKNRLQDNPKAPKKKKDPVGESTPKANWFSFWKRKNGYHKDTRIHSNTP